MRLSYINFPVLSELGNNAHRQLPHSLCLTFGISCKEIVEVLEILLTIDHLVLAGVVVFVYELVPSFSQATRKFLLFSPEAHEHVV